MPFNSRKGNGRTVSDILADQIDQQMRKMDARKIRRYIKRPRPIKHIPMPWW